MSWNNGIARRLIDLAAVIAPADRAEWMRAMQVEFEALEGGQTSWALGCLGVAGRWRLRLDGGFLAGLLLVAATAVQLVNMAAFGLETRMPSAAGHAALASLLYVMLWGTLGLVCLGLAVVRPRYWLFIGLATPAISMSVNLLLMALSFHIPLSQIPTIHVMNARLDVGLGAVLGYSLLGALIGRGIGGNLAARVR